MKSELRELDHQIFKLTETNNAIRSSDTFEKNEVDEICKENEEAIQIKKDRIWDFVKRFGSRHPDLPSTIPFTYNQIEEANGGQPLPFEWIVQILEAEWKLKQAVDSTV